MSFPVRSWWLLLLALGLASVVSAAHSVALFIVTEPWVRVAPDGRSAEAYMELRATEGAALVAVKSDVTAEVAIRPPGATRATVSDIPLAAGTTVKLAPGGYRIALGRLGRPLKLGDRVGLMLTIDNADGRREEIPASAEVRRRSPTDDHRRGHAH